MTRRCSHCSNNGHNSRTCPSGSGGGVKLFGVRLTDGSIIKKSASMGNLSSLHYHSSSSAAASPNPGSPPPDHIGDPTTMIHVSDGYLSDDPAHASCSTNRRGERKKGYNFLNVYLNNKCNLSNFFYINFVFYLDFVFCFWKLM